MPRRRSPAPYLILDTGWAPFDAQRQTRSFAGSAQVIVQAPEAAQATLRVRPAPGSAALEAQGDGSDYVISVSLQPGANPVQLQAREAGGRVEIASLAA